MQDSAILEQIPTTPLYFREKLLPLRYHSGRFSLQSRVSLFSRGLRQLCDQQLSVSSVSRDLGINRQQFARYLNGTSMPRDNIVEKIAKYFDVTTEELFAPTAKQRALSNIALSPAMGALAELMGTSEQGDITEAELPSGIYVQYKQVLSAPNKCLICLARIYRDNGVVRYKRRTSLKFLKHLPGSNVANSNHGVFFKSAGNLILVDKSESINDLTFHSFKTSSNFTANIKPGIHLSAGIGGASSAKAALIFLQRIKPGESILKHARRQGIFDYNHLSDTQRFFLGFDSPPQVGKISVPY